MISENSCKEDGGYNEEEISKEEKTAISILKILVACFFDRSLIWCSNASPRRISLLEQRIHPEAKLKDDLGLDSLDVIILSLITEDAFNIKLHPEEANGWETIMDVLNTIILHCLLSSDLSDFA